MEKAVNTFREFMFEAVYYNEKAKGEEGKVRDILRGLWEYYVNRPDKLPEDYQKISREEGIERAVCDYISGMTDKYAISMYREIYIPAAWR
jgi:dGTPase